MELIIGLLGLGSICALIAVTVYVQYITKPKNNPAPLVGVVLPKKNGDKDA